MRMKRNIIVITAVLALLSAAYYLAVKYEPNSPAEQTPNPVETIVVFEADSEDIQKIGISHSDDSYVLVKNNMLWGVQERGYINIEQQRAESFTYSVSYISASAVIEENAADISIYGLDNPSAVVSVTAGEDEERVFLMGALAPGDNYYYFMEEGINKVYTISKTTGAPYLKKLNDFRDMTITDIDITTVRGIEISSGSDVFSVQYAPLPEGTENPYGTLSVWRIKSPIDYGAENQKVMETLITPACALTAENIVEDLPNNFSKYSFNKKVVIILEDSTVVLNVGAANGVTYVHPEGAISVYSVSGDSLAFANLGPMDVLEKFVSLHNISLVDKIEIQTQNVAWTMYNAQEGGSDYRINEKSASEEAFRSMYQIVAGLTVDGIINKAFGRTDLLGSVTYYMRDGSTDISEFYAYDELSVEVRRGGESIFYMKKTKLADLEEKLKKFAANPHAKV